MEELCAGADEAGEKWEEREEGRSRGKGGESRWMEAKERKGDYSQRMAGFLFTAQIVEGANRWKEDSA